MKRLVLIFAAAFIAGFSASAQPQSREGQQPPRHRQTVSRPQQKADLMKRELSLSDKQYKKVLKVFKQEESSMHPDNGGGMPSGPGMGGPGGGMPGGPGMGGPGGGMGGPGMGAPDGQRPQGPPPGMQQLSDDEIDRIIAKKEKQLRKILSPEQFDTWAKAHPEEFSAIDWNKNPFDASIKFID